VEAFLLLNQGVMGCGGSSAKPEPAESTDSAPKTTSSAASGGGDKKPDAKKPAAGGNKKEVRMVLLGMLRTGT
jgi:hypothetical protein